MIKRFCLVALSLFQLSLQTFPDIPPNCPTIVSKSEWQARTAHAVEYVIIPVKNVIIHHTVTPECETKQACAARIRSIQDFHIETLEFHDIGYNFLIGGDGSVYEGAGWHKVGAHTRGYNSRSLGIALIGDFSDQLPSPKMLKALKDFLACGVDLGELDTNYKLFGARQVSATKSPGSRFFTELKSWSHFTVSP